MKFTHLHAHSTYSALDGYGTVKQIVNRLQDLGHTSAAVTDHGNVIAHIPYMKAFAVAGIKPIYGCEFYIVDNAKIKTSKYIPSLGAEGAPHVTIIAMNQVGYSNLLKLNTWSWHEGFYYKPRIDWNTLEKFQEGLCVLSGCVGGYPSAIINDGRPEDAWRFMSERRSRIEHYYVELIPEPGIGVSHSATPWLIQIANDLKIPMVMTSDAHFPRPEDHIAEDTMLCVGIRSKIDDPTRTLKLPDYQYYCNSEELLGRMYHTIPHMWNDQMQSMMIQAIENSAIIGDMCNVEIPKVKPLFYPGIPPDKDAETLWSWILQGLEDRIQHGFIDLDKKQIYYTRLKEEFDLMQSKGFCHYILCLTDICRWIKSQDILVMCRGSAGGCLILYIVGCSETDSIEHDLDFARFMDPSRMDPPDIDVDFERSQKENIYNYISKKYGEDCVSQILAIGLVRARNAVQDVAAVHGISQEDVAPLKAALDSKDDDVDRQLSDLSDTTALEVLKKYPIFHMIDDVVGQMRNSTIHAAGVLISSEPVTQSIAIMHQPGKPRVASCDKHGAQDIGFMKLDLLAVMQYDVLADAARMLGANMQWIYSLPKDDPDVYKMLQSGKVAGLFQIDGAAIKVGNQIGLDTFDEICAISALCRPGASAHVAEYATNKFNAEAYKKYMSSTHPIAADIVAKTYGIMLYQEQVMKLCNKLALMPMPIVQKLRKRIANASFIGKELGGEYEAMYFEGCANNNVNPEEARRWWENTKAHGIYSFNKAHCYTYGIVGYWMAYIKCHYPEAYFASYLMHEGAETNPNQLLMKRLIREFRELGGSITLIDYRYAKESFSKIGPNAITGGWGNFVGIGKNLASTLVKKGPYQSWEHVQTVMPRTTYYKLHEAGITGAMPYDPQAVAELAPWMPVLSTGGDEKRIKVNQSCPGPGDLPHGESISRTSIICGYVTAIHKRQQTGIFKGEQIIYVLEDENGAVEFRVSSKQPNVANALKKDIKRGDYIAISGWWSGDFLFVREYLLLWRRQ